MAARRSTRRRFDDDTWEPALAPAHDDHRPDQHDLRRRTGDRDDGGPDADDEPVDRVQTAAWVREFRAQQPAASATGG